MLLDVPSLSQVIEPVDLAPIDELHWVAADCADDTFGEFPPDGKRKRTWGKRKIEELVPELLAADPRFVVEDYQIFSSPRRWRGLLWDSLQHGKELRSEEVADILSPQWRAAARIPRDKPFQRVLVKKAIRTFLAEISAGLHSEPLTALSILFLISIFQRAACMTARRTWTRVDPSQAPFDGTTAVATYRRPDDRQVYVCAPVARQWDPSERNRLITYLDVLKDYFQKEKCEYQIHAPRIGSVPWIDFPTVC